MNNIIILKILKEEYSNYIWDHNLRFLNKNFKYIIIQIKKIIWTFSSNNVFLAQIYVLQNFPLVKIESQERSRLKWFISVTKILWRKSCN